MTIKMTKKQITLIIALVGAAVLILAFSGVVNLDRWNVHFGPGGSSERYENNGSGTMNIDKSTKVMPDRDSPFYNAIATGAFDPDKITSVELTMLAYIDTDTTILQNAYGIMDREAVNYRSGKTANLLVEVVDETRRLGLGIGDDLMVRMETSMAICCEAELSNADYDAIIRHTEKVMNLRRPPHVRLRAIHDYAVMLKDDSTIYFPTDKQIAEIRSWDVEYRFAYLQCFALWGVLREGERLDVANGRIAHCDWEQTFALTQKLPYQRIAPDIKGNARAVRYCGLNRYQTNDYGCMVAKAGVKLPTAEPAPILSGWEDVNVIYRQIIAQTDVEVFPIDGFNPYVTATEAPVWAEKDRMPDYRAMAAAFEYPTNVLDVAMCDKVICCGGVYGKAPEPSSAVLLLVGLAGLGLRRKRLV